MTNRKALTYKERQDVMWALEEFAKRLDEHDSVSADESADRLRRLHVKYRNGERG
jgi:hypothetical protein